MDKDFWKSQIFNALELVKLSPSNRGLRALKSMVRKYEKTFNEKLDITLPTVPNKNEKRLLTFKEFYSQKNNCNHDVS